MASVQLEMFRVIGEMVADGQGRGLVNPHIDTVAYCAWFHGMAIGHLVTASSSVDTERWLSVALPAALAPLRP